MATALNVFFAKNEKKCRNRSYSFNDSKRLYLAVKKLSVLLIRITSKHKYYSYCLNCFHPLEQKTNLTRIKK